MGNGLNSITGFRVLYSLTKCIAWISPRRRRGDIPYTADNMLSLQLPVWDSNYSDEMLEYFVKSSASYMRALDSVLAFHFPDADERAKNNFKIQCSI